MESIGLYVQMHHRTKKNKRFEIRFDGYKYFVVVDVENERGIARMDTMSDAQGFLEMYEMFDDIIKELKQKKRGQTP